MLTFEKFDPLNVFLKWTANGFACFIAQDDPDYLLTGRRPQGYILVGRELSTEERAGDAAECKAIGDDFAASLFLAKTMHRQTNKARFFADAVVRGLAQLCTDAAIPTLQREHLASVLDAARLAVENLGGPSSGVNPPPAPSEAG